MMKGEPLLFSLQKEMSSVKVLDRVDRFALDDNAEMKVAAGSPAGAADLRDGLPLLYPCSLFYGVHAVVAVPGEHSVAVVDSDGISEAPDDSGKYNFTGTGGTDEAPFRGWNVHAVVKSAVTFAIGRADSPLEGAEKGLFGKRRRSLFWLNRSGKDNFFFLPQKGKEGLTSQAGPGFSKGGDELGFASRNEDFFPCRKRFFP